MSDDSVNPPATVDALCWEHGMTPHYVTGAEDGVMDVGLCPLCLAELFPDEAERARYLARGVTP